VVKFVCFLCSVVHNSWSIVHPLCSDVHILCSQAMYLLYYVKLYAILCITMPPVIVLLCSTTVV